MQPKIDKIIIKHKIDETPDWSYLETEYEKLNGKIKIFNSAQISQDFALKHPKLALKHIKQNEERLKEANSGRIWQVGIIAEATVLTKEGEAFRIETFTSGGLWGIESDSDKSYIAEVEQQELAYLKQHLEAFNVDVSNFDQLAGIAEIED